MARRKPEVTVHSHGLYDRWDRDSKELPNLVRMTLELEAVLGVEFGYTLRIRNARNSKLTFLIAHPAFTDASGKVAPPFEGELYVKTNDYRVFLGDTVWSPVEDKRGEWRLVAWLDGRRVADKTFLLT